MRGIRQGVPKIRTPCFSSFPNCQDSLMTSMWFWSQMNNINIVVRIISGNYLATSLFLLPEASI